MLLYWIWFAQLEKLPAGLKHAMLEHFRDPEEIYHSDLTTISRMLQVPEQVLESLENKDLRQADLILKECADKSISILSLNDQSYPNRLRYTDNPPLVLYVRGQLPDWDAQPIIGVVGTRKASAYGLNVAKQFGEQISLCGGLVISGGAAGIDSMAMEGAIAVGKPVLGVLGCGVDVVYPASNRLLFQKVVQNGCLISEYPPRTPGLSWHFPERNRIISGISNGLLVVEAPAKSGALNTAKHAMEQGREVFAVPGNVGTASCEGSNGLLQDGAFPALSGWGVVREYRDRWPNVVRQVQPKPEAMVAQNVQIPEPQPAIPMKKAIDKEDNSTYSVLENQQMNLTPSEKTILAMLGREPVAVDDVIARADMEAREVKGILTRLTIKRLTITHPGGRISLK